jgi:ATP-binding cassette subfamily C (CFTR/MRP) protein 1
LLQDLETDAAIQSVLRTEFRSSTLLIIAHRIDTVMECNRVMVFDAGRLVEFDSPTALLQRPDSLFANLVRASAAGSNSNRTATKASETTTHGQQSK